MRPIDPRLMRYASAMRGFLAAGGVLGLVQTGCIVVFAWLVSRTVADTISGSSLNEIGVLLAWMAGVVAVRAGLVWLLDTLAARAAASVKSQLKTRLVSAVTRLGPGWLSGRNSASVSTVSGPGLDALDNYFRAYLPQLVLAALATPAIAIVLLSQDVLTGIIVCVTLPLIPIFMAMIGLATRFVQQKHWAALTTLSTAFLDLVEGLATLKIFGREHRQLDRIDDFTERYRLQTMRVLRVSFLSGFVLELIASLSVAVVAVSVGVRLIDGSLPLSVGLFVLILVPEAYLPLRQVGVQFHAAAEGLAAAEDVFAILDEEALDDKRPTTERSLSSSKTERSLSSSTTGRSLSSSKRNGASFDELRGRDTLTERSLRLTDVTVRYGERTILSGMSATFEPGTVTAITGLSGGGKSSLFAAILGFVPADGRIDLGDADLLRLRPEDRLAAIAWCGQCPGLVRDTVAANVALGDLEPRQDRVVAALAQAGAAAVDPHIELGVGGSGLSGGQAQRVAIARAFYRAERLGTPILLVDEPSSALDAEHERLVIAGLRQHAQAGRIVLVISHRRPVIDAADAVFDIAAGAGRGSGADEPARHRQVVTR